jgi:hypothetical protein
MTHNILVTVTSLFGFSSSFHRSASKIPQRQSGKPPGTSARIESFSAANKPREAPRLIAIGRYRTIKVLAFMGGHFFNQPDP